MGFYSDIRTLLITAILATALAACENPESAWELAEREDTPAAYLEFLARYPEGPLAERARARMAELKELRAWERAQFRDRIDNYERFLQQHPDSGFAEQARASIRRLESEKAWQAASDDGSVSVLRAFLSQYPESVHSAQARERIASLTLDETPGKLREPPGDYRLQLGAFRSAQAADTEVRRLSRLFPELLDGPIRIDGPDDSGWFILKSAPMAREDADRRCGLLAARGQNCLIVNR